ncbi:MAG TPA: hypothetical protein VKA02_02880 [Candidatus Acidoferrum sp.]|nr:hypothetical protein [Candidatus Acidoferrum sp.]HXR33244.1 hypothetical protein [Verrucomicrobiae bacterium]
MTYITCPLCGSPIQQRGFFGQGKPFCAHCGWNLERAESSLKEKSRVPLFIFVAFAIMAIGLFWVSSSAGRGKPPVTALPILAVFALAGGLPLWSYLSTKRAIALAQATPSTKGMQAQPIPDAFLQRIQSLPRPRRVRFRFPGASAGIVAGALAMLFGIMFFATARVKPPVGPRDATPVPYVLFLAPITFVFLVVGIVSVPALLKAKRNRPLFQDGEVAAARVLAQRTVAQGKASYSQIDYEFRASDGQTIRNSERDLSRKVFEDMLIPVFYDPREPSRCAALCASYSKLPDAEG